MDYDKAKPLFATGQNIPVSFPVFIFPVEEIELEQNRDIVVQGLLTPAGYILQQMICQKVPEPVHEFVRSCGNLHYQLEKIRLKISSVRFRTISSSNWASAA